MADFKTQQKIIIEFIEKNFINYLPDEFKIFELTTDFLDFDKHKGNCTLFIDFTKIGFPNSNYKDDCGNIENLSVTVYLVHRNNTAPVLNELNLDASFAFYKMIQENPSLGIAQNTTIEGIDFYKYVEGQKYLVCTEINLLLEIEI
jgi:hypothetical protein